MEQRTTVPEPEVRGEGTVTAPADRTEQVANLEATLERCLRHREWLEERIRTIEVSLALAREG